MAGEKPPPNHRQTSGPAPAPGFIRAAPRWQNARILPESAANSLPWCAVPGILPRQTVTNKNSARQAKPSAQKCNHDCKIADRQSRKYR
jgi:hypothetical protein